MTSPAAGPHYDILIVGGGPAGLCAGLYAARARMRVAILEPKMPGGALLLTHAIENWPGETLIGGMALAEKMAAQTLAAGCEILQAPVTAVRRDAAWRSDAPRWVVETEWLGNFTATCVILAAGGEHRKLGVPGEAEYAGRGVSYCATCDANFTRDHVVVAVGGGDAACEESDYLARYASHVYLVHRRDEFRASPIVLERVRTNPKITIVPDTIVEEVLGAKGDVTGVRLRGTRRPDGGYDFAGIGAPRELATQFVFPFLGFVPNGTLVAEHVAHDAGGHFVTDGTMQTSLPGLFAVGDVRAQVVRQVTTAVGDGTTAAVSAAHLVTELRAAGGVG